MFRADAETPERSRKRYDVSSAGGAIHAAVVLPRSTSKLILSNGWGPETDRDPAGSEGNGVNESRNIAQLLDQLRTVGRRVVAR